MKITFLGHAAFEVALDDGKRIVFDPYESGSFNGALAYGPIEGDYDLAVVSHDHADHCCESVTSKARRVVDGAGEFDFEGIKITTYPTFHDESGGSERGKNLISVIEAEGLTIAHLGDLGHPLSVKEMGALKGIDILLIPVGGYFTIDAEVASKIVTAVGPKMVIPMHFKTAKVDFPIATVDDFISRMDNVETAGGSEIVLSKEILPEMQKVVVLDPAK
ncbi:MAG: MBL fold metallo-hydrolase [bacterium]|nr:MAG: MBL fold metallo-hydrolase [bacterium]